MRGYFLLILVLVLFIFSNIGQAMTFLVDVSNFEKIDTHSYSMILDVTYDISDVAISPDDFPDQSDFEYFAGGYYFDLFAIEPISLGISNNYGNYDIGRDCWWSGYPLANLGTQFEYRFDYFGASSDVLSFDYHADFLEGWYGKRVYGIEDYRGWGSSGVSFNGNFNVSLASAVSAVPAAVPEPITFLLFGLGLVGVNVKRFLKKK